MCLEVLKSRTPILLNMACWSCKAEARARRTLGETLTVLVECTHEQEPKQSLPKVETRSLLLPPIEEESLPKQAPLSEERKRAIIGAESKTIPPDRKLKPLCLWCKNPHGRTWAASYCGKKCRAEAVKAGIVVQKNRVQA